MAICRPAMRHNPGSLSAGLTRELLMALLGNTPASAEFFQLPVAARQSLRGAGNPAKNPPQDPGLFATYPNLALAIAVVYEAVRRHRGGRTGR